MNGLGKTTRLTERELGDLVERAYVAQGAVNGLHYFGVTPRWTRPRSACPSTRQVRRRDVVFAELTAILWDYPGQVLRTFALGEPTALYRELHTVADAAFETIPSVLRDGVTPAEIIAAAGASKTPAAPPSTTCCTATAAATARRYSARRATRRARYPSNHCGRA